ncbi:hypothetical protein OTK49_18245 [Vibrio coralliirubri]|uniref:hypothetical protein n=1 Tax=Vibrio coralliirubri TaxID=1516159 RepID=UPI0022844FE6|nr:hypothetical protein [Vibrio coralliirubri]MCY9864458.1 hypothetical protein [Vibrio coralliirubri]
MKAIVSLFISAYQPGMASIECRANSLIQSRQPLLFSDSDGSGQVLNYEAGGYKESQMEDCYFNEDECGDAPSYEDICWMINRAQRKQPMGYYVMYLRYVGYHSGYAKTVATRLRQHIVLHPNLKESLSTSLITLLQQHEDAFCQTLHQQLTEFHTSR